MKKLTTIIIAAVCLLTGCMGDIKTTHQPDERAIVNLAMSNLPEADNNLSKGARDYADYMYICNDKTEYFLLYCNEEKECTDAVVRTYGNTSSVPLPFPYSSKTDWVKCSGYSECVLRLSKRYTHDGLLTLANKII